MHPIYLDNNATTPLLPAVWEAMRPYAVEIPGNPASAHQWGRQARTALEDARDQVAAHVGALAEEVIFTSGATEANNQALFSLAGKPPGHLLASPLEHPSVVEPLKHFQETGFALDFLPVGRDGVILAEDVNDRIRSDTRCVAVMLANHETGAIQPVKEIVHRMRRDVPVHCDAVQAVGKIPVNFHDLGVATLSFSAHKFHGPKGIGALVVRLGMKIRPHLLGGHQQRGLRPGTESAALAVGLATAFSLAVKDQAERCAQVRRVREAFVSALRQEAMPFVINGSAAGLPHTLNVSFPPLKADVLLMNFDLAGIACSTGSACSSGSLLPSPVLQAMGTPAAVLNSAMRFSFSYLLNEKETAEAGMRIGAIVKRLRQDRSGA